jgi:hypothetical protein
MRSGNHPSFPGRSAAQSDAPLTRDRSRDRGVGPGSAAHRFALHRARGTLVALIALVLTVLAAPAFAQVSTPAPGTPLRAAILDAVRPMVEAEVGRPVEFVVTSMRVLGEWAFVDLTPQRPGGGPIEFVYSRYQAAVDAHAFDNQVVALLRNTPRGWLVYRYSLGATDVAWYGWWMYFPVPEQVFPPH